MLKCPYCGWTYKVPQQNPFAVPTHSRPDDIDNQMSVCPGVGQAPRNAESDNRPLWQEKPQ